MSIAEIFIKTERKISEVKNGEAKVKTVSFDAYLEESHTSTIEVSNNPVELGAEVSDHAIIIPKVIRIVIAVSDTPMGFEALTAIAGNVQRLFAEKGTKLTRSQQAYRDLIAMQESRVLLEVQTGLKLYKNMLITNIQVGQDKDSSRSVEMVVDMQELIIVETEVRAIKKDQLPEGRSKWQAESKTELGKKAKNKPTDSQTESVLSTLRGYFVSGVEAVVGVFQ